MVEGGHPAKEPFWVLVWEAMQRLLALLMFVGVHYVLNWALRVTVPPRMEKALDLVQAFLYVMFLLVYLYLAWDMVTVFIPRLKRRQVDATLIRPSEEAEESLDAT